MGAFGVRRSAGIFLRGVVDAKGTCIFFSIFFILCPPSHQTRAEPVHPHHHSSRAAERSVERCGGLSIFVDPVLPRVCARVLLLPVERGSPGGFRGEDLSFAFQQTANPNVWFSVQRACLVPQSAAPQAMMCLLRSTGHLGPLWLVISLRYASAPPPPPIGATIILWLILL